MALSPERHGLMVAGGKGKTSRKTPDQILSSPFDFSDAKRKELVYSSRMVAKVDNSLVQDGFQLYHHAFFLSEKGDWAVVQQGMRDKGARRYHWISDLDSFIVEPHAAICCDQKNENTLDLTSRKNEEIRKTSLDLVKDNPAHLRNSLGGQQTLTSFDYDQSLEPKLTFKMPRHHPVLDTDISPRGWEAIQKAYELQPQNYEELVSLSGMGAKSIRSLALISELVYGTEAEWKDPVHYSYAHGGKDGFPYPVDKPTYDSSIQFLEDAIKNANVGENEKLGAIRRLHEFI